MNRYIKYLSATGAAILLTLIAFAFVAAVHAGTTFFAVNKTGLETSSLFSATTTSATSTNLGGGGGFYKLDGARSATVFFQRGGTHTANAGSSVFKVQMSPDEVNWYDYGLLVSATSTSQGQYGLNGFTDTVTLSGTSTQAFGLDLRTTAVHALRCIVVQNTDGEHTCSISAQF